MSEKSYNSQLTQNQELAKGITYGLSLSLGLYVSWQIFIQFYNHQQGSTEHDSGQTIGEDGQTYQTKNSLWSYFMTYFSTKNGISKSQLNRKKKKFKIFDDQESSDDIQQEQNGHPNKESFSFTSNKQNMKTLRNRINSKSEQNLRRPQNGQQSRPEQQQQQVAHTLQHKNNVDQVQISQTGTTSELEIQLGPKDSTFDSSAQVMLKGGLTNNLSQNSEQNDGAKYQDMINQITKSLQQTLHHKQQVQFSQVSAQRNIGSLNQQIPHGDISRSPKGYQHTLTQRQLNGDKPKDEQTSWESRQYSRITTNEGIVNDEQKVACYSLQQIIDLRNKWIFRTVKTPEASDIEDPREAAVPSDLLSDIESIWKYQEMDKMDCHIEMVDGVVRIFNNSTDREPLTDSPGTATQFFTDSHDVDQLINSGPVKTFSHQRLTLLEQKFQMFSMLNAYEERQWMQKAPHRDFYNVRKIDTHIHHSACMHQKHLLRFIKKKLKDEPDQVVIFRDGKYLTLKEVFESLGIRAYDLNVDTMDMHADQSIFHRFDKFNNKYNPCGQSRLREIFIKQENLIQGKYLAQLSMEVFDDLKESKYQHTENRISIYGRKAVEWDILANWICKNRLYSDNNIWMIQIPRLYQIYKKEGLIENFQQMLDNIFMPLFEVTQDPSSHTDLHVFLSMVIGFDMVDDESKPERRVHKHMPAPENWNNRYNPAFTYYCYYIYANLYVLNKFRELRGLNSFSFRPHAGEAGEMDHLISCFLSAQGINHGINLRKSPGLQYCYYIEQIALAMSPLSNNTLFLDYHKNPFPVYFARGLNVSLSTDDPVQIHLTQEPLVEEYSVAAQVWRMSSTDLCEVARNSVLQSGFPHGCKKHWVGNYYWLEGPDGNDINKTNVPNMRLQYRSDTLQNERVLIHEGTLQYAESIKK